MSLLLPQPRSVFFSLTSILSASLTKKITISLNLFLYFLVNSGSACIYIFYQPLTWIQVKGMFQKIYPILLTNSLDPVLGQSSQWAFQFNSFFVSLIQSSPITQKINYNLLIASPRYCGGFNYEFAFDIYIVYLISNGI